MEQISEQLNAGKFLNSTTGRVEQPQQEKKKFDRKEYIQTHLEDYARRSYNHYEKNKHNPEFMQKKRDRAKARYYKLKEEREQYKKLMLLHPSVPEEPQEIQEVVKSKAGRPRKYNYDDN